MAIDAPSSTFFSPWPDRLRHSAIILLAAGLAHDGPFSIRFPRGSAPSRRSTPLEPLPVGRARVIQHGGDIALLAIGKMVGVAEAAALQLAESGIGATVVDARFVKPLDPELATLAARHRAVLTVEDGTLAGGFGSAVLELLAECGVSVPVRRLGLPDHFIEHGAQSVLLSGFGLSPEGVAAAARELLPRSASALAG